MVNTISRKYYHPFQTAAINYIFKAFKLYYSKRNAHKTILFISRNYVSNARGQINTLLNSIGLKKI